MNELHEKPSPIVPGCHVICPLEAHKVTNSCKGPDGHYRGMQTSATASWAVFWTPGLPAGASESSQLTAHVPEGKVCCYQVLSAANLGRVGGKGSCPVT